MTESVVDIYDVPTEKQDDPQSNKYGSFLLKEGKWDRTIVTDSRFQRCTNNFAEDKNYIFNIIGPSQVVRN